MTTESRPASKWCAPKGHLWWRKEWYSICSAHIEPDPICRSCHHGSYVNVWGNAISRFVFWLCPSAWRWWANRSH